MERETGGRRWETLTAADLGRWWKHFLEVPPRCVVEAWIATALTVDAKAFPWALDTRRPRAEVPVPDYGPVEDSDA